MREIRSALLELTIVRVKEFVRETEALFWVFGFPLLMTVALGFAFRDSGPERVPVGIVDGPSAAHQLQALASSPALQPRIYSTEEGRAELRRGNILDLSSCRQITSGCSALAQSTNCWCRARIPLTFQVATFMVRRLYW